MDQLSVISFTVLFGPQGAIFKLPCFPRSTIILNQFKEPIRGIIKDSNGITLQKHTKAKSDDQHRKKSFIFSFDDATQGKRKALHTAKRIHLEYCIGAGRKSDISAALTEENK